ncbi:MAG: hypothetical protein ACRDTP_06850 [Mycobacteriales bacterium]
MAPSRMSKREQKDLRRLRREEAQLRARRKRFWLNMGVVGGAVLVAAVVLGLVALSIHDRGGSPAPSTSTSPTTTGTATGTPTGTATASGTATGTTAASPSAATRPTAGSSPAR